MTDSVLAVLRAVAASGGSATPEFLLLALDQPRRDPRNYLGVANRLCVRNGVTPRLLRKHITPALSASENPKVRVEYHITTAGLRALRREEKGRK